MISFFCYSSEALPYVDDIDNLLQTLRLATAMSCYVHVTLGNRDIAVWHGHVLGDVLNDGQMEGLHWVQIKQSR